jgi:hypothetical protein
MTGFGHPIEISVQPGIDSLAAAVATRLKSASPAVLHLSAGRFIFSHPLRLPRSTRIVGAGDRTILVAAPPVVDSPCGLVISSNCELESIHVIYQKSKTRQLASDTAILYVVEAKNVLIRKVTVEGSASTGILVEHSTSVMIDGCSVYGTLADGIHVTNGSRNVTISGCEVHDVADDGIATVSYRSKAPQCDNVTIVCNHVRCGRARGIANIGSKNVVIVNNVVEECAAGIYAALETYYDTYYPNTVYIYNNLIMRCGSGTGMQGLLVGSASHISIINNRFYKCAPAYIADTGGRPNQNLIISGNHFDETSHNGHAPIEISDTIEGVLTSNSFQPSLTPSIFIGKGCSSIAQ